MTDEQADRIEQKLDVLLEMMRSLQKPINILGELLVEAEYVTKARRLNKQTISQNEKLEKFNEIGKRRVLMTLRGIGVIRNRKRKVNIKK